MLAWIDLHPWVIGVLGFCVWPLARWVAERQHLAHERLTGDIRRIDTDIQAVRGECSDVRGRLALHRQEDATVHARVDGEVIRLREAIAALPTQRDVASLGSAIERMRCEVTQQLGTVAVNVRAVDVRVGSLAEMMDHTRQVVDRHDMMISDAAARRGVQNG